MKILTLRYDGAPDQVAEAINTEGTARFVLSFVHVDEARQKVTVLFRFEGYPDYLWFCEKAGRKPRSTRWWSQADL